MVRPIAIAAAAARWAVGYLAVIGVASVGATLVSIIVGIGTTRSALVEFAVTAVAFASPGFLVAACLVEAGRWRTAVRHSALGAAVGSITMAGFLLWLGHVILPAFVALVAASIIVGALCGLAYSAAARWMDVQSAPLVDRSGAGVAAT